jgi:hypothetical protein
MPKEVAMDIVHPRVAGIDVHKKVIWVAVRLPGSVPGERKVNVRSFKTFWRSLQKMAAWLAVLGVTDAAMESTGAAAGQLHPGAAGRGVTGAHEIPQEADRAPGLGEPAAAGSAGGRRDKD